MQEKTSSRYLSKMCDLSTMCISERRLFHISEHVITLSFPEFLGSTLIKQVLLVTVDVDAMPLYDLTL